jgi:hypothetical protein
MFQQTVSCCFTYQAILSIYLIPSALSATPLAEPFLIHLFINFVSSYLTSGYVVLAFMRFGRCLGSTRADSTQFWAALRNLCQIYAQHPKLAGGAQLGIRIIQVTQLFNILGSGGGYQLAANAFVASLVVPEKRTGMFGILGGMVMAGAGLGYICEFGTLQAIHLDMM